MVTHSITLTEEGEINERSKIYSVNQFSDCLFYIADIFRVYQRKGFPYV